MTGGSYTALTPPAAGEYILRQWGVDVRDSVILRFASASARDAALTGLTASDEGLAAFLQDANYLSIYNGSIWVPSAPRLVSVNNFAGNVTSTGTEVAMTAWSSGTSSCTFQVGHIYKLILSVSLCNTGTSNAIFDNTIRLRKGVNSTTNQQLGIWRLVAGGGTSPVITSVAECFVHNATAADISSAVGLTVTKSTGTNAVLTGNSADNPVRLEIWDMGATANLSSTELTATLSTAIV